MCAIHPAIEARGISEATCDLLGIGYLPQGRSPLKGRIVFQVADARETADGTGKRTRVILSHLGRALSDDVEPKYLFYQGFHKSVELYGQELIWLHEDAAAQARARGGILLTEGPFDVAKAVEAGFRNVVGSFGAALSTPPRPPNWLISAAFLALRQFVSRLIGIQQVRTARSVLRNGCRRTV